MEVIITPDFGELYKSHKKETMTEEKRWKILERVTTGWHLIANNADELTKAECDRMLKELVDQGQNPGDLKAVPQDDPRFPTEKTDPGYIPTNL
tara:strand:+ start:240 stop:521 length:282 start_codon:yes stop_codon:yes gene_type:complete